MAASSEICDARRQNYKDINQILNVVLVDSDEDIDLGEENSNYNDGSDWEYEAEHPQPTVTFVADPQSDDIMVDNDNNPDVPEPTPVVEQAIPAGVMIPEHNTKTDELLDADDTSGGWMISLFQNKDGEVPFVVVKIGVFVPVVVVMDMVYIPVVVQAVWQMVEPDKLIILIGPGKK